MKRIVCYGDSNTWGFAPGGGRYDASERWTGVLAQQLGERYRIIAQGMNGRTTMFDDPAAAGRNGLSALPPCLATYRPIDLVIVMLGSNDAKARFSACAATIAAGIEAIVDVALASGCGRNGAAPAVLLLAPPPFGALGESAGMFAGGTDKSREFGSRFGMVAASRRCFFLDAATLIRSSEIDGIHLDASEHRKLGGAVATLVREILTDGARKVRESSLTTRP